jgi:methylmalonyl-CoA mutase
MEKKDQKFGLTEFPIPTYEQWREITEKALKGRPFETLLTTLIDDIVLKPMYQERDIEDSVTLNNQPGSFPFVRGTELNPRAWEISQELEAPTPKLFNEWLKHDLERGQNVIHIILSNQIKNGRKSIIAKEEDGLPLFDLKDVKAALNGLDQYRFYIDTGVISLPLLAALASCSDRLEGTIASDPIHQLAKEGSLDYSLQACFDYMKTAIEWVNYNKHDLRTVLVQTHVYHNGGASPAQELAMALSTGVTYVHELVERGLSPDDAGKTITFSFSIGSDFFSEVAKIRAARFLWASIMKEFGAEEEGQKMTIHARTSSFTKSKQDLYVNLLRGTSEAFAAAVAGVDSLHVSPFDEPLQSSSSFSRRIARNTSLILQEEAYIGITKDPAGGSWFVEHLTEQMAEKAWDQFQEIERSGGIVSTLKNGFIQTAIEKTWKKRKLEVESRKQTIVGVNRYVNLMDKLPPSPSNFEQERQTYAEKLDRDIQMEIKNRPATIEHLNELLIKNVPIHVLYELLQDELRESGVIPIQARRITEPFEKLRNKSKELKERTGKNPTVFLLGLGSLAEHKARVDFISEFFLSGGFDVQVSSPVSTVEEAVREAAHSKMIVICGSEDCYQLQALPIVNALLNKRERTIFLAGRVKKELENELLHAGIQGCIHLKSNAYQVLDELLEELGGAIQ